MGKDRERSMRTGERGDKKGRELEAYQSDTLLVTITARDKERQTAQFQLEMDLGEIFSSI
jgi:hypothetical protein